MEENLVGVERCESYENVYESLLEAVQICGGMNSLSRNEYSSLDILSVLLTLAFVEEPLLKKNVRFFVPQKIFLGDKVFIGENCILYANTSGSKIFIENCVHSSQDVVLTLRQRVTKKYFCFCFQKGLRQHLLLDVIAEDWKIERV